LKIWCIEGMEQITTAELRLHADAAHTAALRRTQLAYRDAMNHVSAHAFAYGKQSGAARLQRETYADIRERYELPSQLACNVPRQVAATYKALWTRAKANADAIKAGVTKHTLHADLVGARNIALRTLLIRQDWMGTGALYAPMSRTLKPKPRASPGTRSCGGAQRQAPRCNAGVADHNTSGTGDRKGG